VSGYARRVTRLPLVDAVVPAPTRADAPVEMEPSAEETVVGYHERTKHHYRRFAASLGYLDWATQLDSLRRYDGAPLVGFPLPKEGRDLPYWQLYVTPGVKPAPLTAESISIFFRYSLSLTAWKRAGESTWALRANPSSGNLHPTEGYALLPAVGDLSDVPGVYHYAPKAHGLERRADVDAEAWAACMAPYPVGSFFVGLSSIHGRESWKYGERAFRYCQHDVGHAIGTLRFAAATLGWGLWLLERIDDSAVARLLGLDRDQDFEGAEREQPELLALVGPATARDTRRPEESISPAIATRWYGKANVLSPEPGVEWPVIDEVARATSNSRLAMNEDLSGYPSEEELFELPIRSGSRSAETVILGRRSAVSMDASTAIPAATFFRMMGRLVPAAGGRSVPWDAIPWRPRIHLGLFVHRVVGLPSGLYALARDPARVDPLQRVMRREFLWQRPLACPRGLPLYLLEEGDFRALAAQVSCAQDIAGDGAFSLGMIADYMGSLASRGAGFYRNLFWEAGLVGQVLYLEAEEAGIRATGIGCYFDDPVHDVFGITSRDWQSLYHFTVGGPVDDARLTTLPAYSSEQER
jgi:SagB-type dehydrogenase family enzyme